MGQPVTFTCDGGTTDEGYLALPAGGSGPGAMVLPDGWAVNDDRLGKSMGSKTIKVSRTPAPGAPLLVLYGSVGLGSLKVRPPSGRELRRITG